MARGPDSDAPAPAERLATDRDRIVAATSLAWSWHGEETRKGRVTSYMSHLTQVHGLVIQAGGGPDEAIAALLHDGLEDAPSPAARAEREASIEQRFGPDVLRIVLDCTDTRPDEAASTKRPWHERKRRYLDQLREAETDSLRVAACDKLHNLGELVADLRHEGPATLERFNAGAADQLWYFGALLELFRGRLSPRLVQDLEDRVAEFRALAGGDDAGSP